MSERQQQAIYVGIKFPTKAFILKFLKGDIPADGRLNNRLWLGKLLMQNLAKPDSEIALQVGSSEFDAELEVKIPYDWFLRGNRSMSAKQVLLLNGILEDVFFAQLYTAVDVGFEAGGGKISKADLFDCFMDRYNIVDEELQFETLRKRYFRQQKAAKKVG